MGNLDARWMGLLAEQRRYHDLDRNREDLMMAAMLTGEDIHIFGVRAQVRLEWPDGQPFSDEQLRAYGESMKARALERQAALSASH